MITLPISDLLLLPGVTFFFKKRCVSQWRDNSRICWRRYIIYNGKRRKGADDTG